MNNDIFEGNWKQLKGDIQQKWGKLSDDDFDQIEGNREKFIGVIQKNYGIAREEAEEQVRKWQKMA